MVGWGEIISYIRYGAWSLAGRTLNLPTSCWRVFLTQRASPLMSVPLNSVLKGWGSGWVVWGGLVQTPKNRLASRSQVGGGEMVFGRGVLSRSGATLRWCSPCAARTKASALGFLALYS